MLLSLEIFLLRGLFFFAVVNMNTKQILGNEKKSIIHPQTFDYEKV
jgi:hypothetical protein